MVYIFILYSAANSAAVLGSISPLLLLPSDKSIITLLSTSLSLNRFVPFAIAIPIAVPSFSFEAIVISLIREFNTALSMVRGHWINVSPANTNMPILS